MDDLKKIFTGEITNWKEVGGQDLEIMVINRASGPARARCSRRPCSTAPRCLTALSLRARDSSGTAAKMVKDTPGAISTWRFSYYDSSIKALFR